LAGLADYPDMVAAFGRKSAAGVQAVAPDYGRGRFIADLGAEDNPVVIRLQDITLG
jgi:hypothetical protein